MAYYTLEPFGDEIADLRHGVAVSTLANVHRDPKRRPNPYTISDFIYWRAPDDAAPVLLDDPDQQTELLMSAMFGGMEICRTN